MRTRLLFTAVLILMSSAIASEAAEVVVRLKTDKEIIGELLEQDDSSVTLKLKGLTMKIQRDNIAEIVPYATATPFVSPPTATPTPDMQQILRRAAYEWGVRFITSDFAGAWERSSIEFQEAIPKEQYVAACRNWFGPFGTTDPAIQSVNVEGGRGIVTMEVPPNPGSLKAPGSWPWTTEWVHENGVWRQSPGKTGQPMQSMRAVEVTPTPTVTPRPTVYRVPAEEPTRGSADTKIVDLGSASPTPAPTMRQFVAEEVIPDVTQGSMVEANTISLRSLWSDMSESVKAIVASLFFIHLIVCVLMFIDTRRRHGRALITFIWAMAGGVLTLCPPLAWVAYLIVRAKS